jgi:hypothetical protein
MERLMDEPILTISPDKVCYIAIKAREFDAKDVETDPDPGSNPSDDSMVAVLESHADDPVYQELQEFIDGLSEDEQVDLVTIAWLGRGDGVVADWNDLRREARRAHNDHTAAYLLAKPMLSDHLIDGLEALGRSCDAFEKEHL